MPFEDMHSRRSFISINISKEFVSFFSSSPEFETRLNVPSLHHDEKEKHNLLAELLERNLLRYNFLSANLWTA
jgi:hypothetical protein